jgi:ketosteroid isomerase-like protein
MTDHANTQLVQQAFRNYRDADIPSFLNVLADNVEWIVPDMPNVPFAGTWRGRQAVGHFFIQLAEVQDVLEFQPEQFISQGDTVVVLGRFTMRIKASGRQYSSAWAQVWKVEHGKGVTYVREYVDTLAVSRAHGASDPE